ncbi:SHUGOSHIN 1 isoform X2 [Ricinus communis]|uniref:SHUGOSHIN 1 isoform X2 n=1 Tax=Ricinus communis TaxID=3988 RepID=UPI00201A5055|nr:SHUGOSHIN 1 isoform X2 [Ricinus communis]
MDGDVVLNKENQNVKGNKMKGDEKAKGFTVVGNMPRKKLGDISNLPQKNQDMRPPSVSLNTKDYIHKLHQENLTLVKLIADRNKIIQSHALELQKSRTQCQQVQEKNLELARLNSQMLAELNSNKDRLKVVQHDLGCKNGLLKAMQLEIGDKANMVRCNIHGNEAETTRGGEIGNFSKAHNRDKVLCSKRRKRLDPTSVKPVKTKEKIDKNRSKAGEQDLFNDTFEISDALDPPMDKPVEAEKKIDEKRLCLRRQSDRFKTVKQETANDSFQITDALDPPTDKPVEENKVDEKRLCSRRQSARLKAAEQGTANDSFWVSNALGPSMDKPNEAEKRIDEKRLCSRRQSARLKAAEQDTANDSFQISDALDPPMDKPVEAEKKIGEKRQSARLKAAEQEAADGPFQITDALDPTMVKPHQAEKKADNKRLCSRKQSARFESQEQVQEPTEDSFQINDAKFPVSSLYEHGPTSSVSAVKVEPEAAYSASGPEAQELRRSSFRPKRQVADKVQSYKEIPLNVKMRRPH